MPLLRDTKLPPPPELGEKTFWDYFPKSATRRVFFLLLALAAVIFLKTSSGGTFGGFFDPVRPTPGQRATPRADDPGFTHLEVKPSPPPKSAP